MPRKIEKLERQEKTPAAAESVTPVREEAVKPYQYIRNLGYANYTFANEFEYADLNTDQRPYPMAKKVDVMLIKEDDGSANYVGLAFVGVLDDPLFMILMSKEKAAECVKKIKGDSDFVGLQFTGLTKHFGNVALVALPREVYTDLAGKFAH